jgi:hypothetical protein
LLYKSQHPGHFVNSGIALPGYGNFILPDMVDFNLAEIGEYKPLSGYGFATGTTQIEAAIVLANGGGVTVFYNKKNILANQRPITHQAPLAPNGQVRAWSYMTWEPIGQVVFPIATPNSTYNFTEWAAMLVGTYHGVLYYLKIPYNSSKQQPNPVLVPQLERVILESCVCVEKLAGLLENG